MLTSFSKCVLVYEGSAHLVCYSQHLNLQFSPQLVCKLLPSFQSLRVSCSRKWNRKDIKSAHEALELVPDPSWICLCEFDAKDDMCGQVQRHFTCLQMGAQYDKVLLVHTSTCWCTRELYTKTLTPSPSQACSKCSKTQELKIEHPWNMQVPPEPHNRTSACCASAHSRVVWRCAGQSTRWNVFLIF